MIVDLAGLWDDGSNLAPSMLGNARHDVYVTRGADITVRLAVLNNDGSPTLLAAEDVAKLYVRKSARDSVYTLNLTGSRNPLAGPNSLEFVLAPADLRFVSPGRYLFDVWLTHGGITNVVVPMSAFIIQPGLSLPPITG